MKSRFFENTYISCDVIGFPLQTISCDEYHIDLSSDVTKGWGWGSAFPLKLWALPPIKVATANAHYEPPYQTEFEQPSPTTVKILSNGQSKRIRLMNIKILFHINNFKKSDTIEQSNIQMITNFGISYHALTAWLDELR